MSDTHLLTLRLKAVPATFLLVCFSSLKKSTSETRENIFYVPSRALFVLRKSHFNILDIQILWRHQMSKHKTPNTFY